MKTVIEMAREAGFTEGELAFMGDNFIRFAELVRADAIADEREACHALRQTLPNPYDHCQVSAHAHDMAIAAYGAAIRARSNT